MKINKTLIIALVAIAIIAGVGISIFSSKDMQSLFARDSAKSIAPEVIFQTSFEDLQGKMQSLAQWKGKVIILNFWATWCPPCLAEIPEFIQLQKQYSTRGLQFIGIAIDQKDKVQTFTKDMGMNYPILLGDMPGIDLSRKIGNTQGGLPFTVIIDRNGNIAATQLGILSQEKLENIIKPLL